jgi:hypothetical protein
MRTWERGLTDKLQTQFWPECSDALGDKISQTILVLKGTKTNCPYVLMSTLYHFFWCLFCILAQFPPYSRRTFLKYQTGSRVRSRFSHNVADGYKHHLIRSNRQLCKYGSCNSLSLPFDLLRLLNSRPHWIFISESAFGEVWAGYWPHTVYLTLWRQKWRTTGIQRLHHLFGQWQFRHFRQQLKFPVSVTLSLKELWKTTWKFLIPHSENHTGNDKTCRYTGTALSMLVLLVSWPCCVWIASAVQRKFCSEL